MDIFDKRTIWKPYAVKLAPGGIIICGHIAPDGAGGQKAVRIILIRSIAGSQQMVLI